MLKRKCKIIFLVFTTFLSIFFSNHSSFIVLASSDLSNRLKENIIPLETIEAGSGFHDLSLMKEVTKNKKIIGLGESTLGSREFFQLKHRIIEFLVEEMDYRLFAIDAEFADGQTVNKYINGEGNIEDALWALKHFNWAPEKMKDDFYKVTGRAYLSSWTTEEFKDILNWMKEYNATADYREKIKFYGIDLEIPDTNMESLLEYLYTVDEETGKKYEKKLKDLIMAHGLNFKYPEDRSLGLFTGMLEELDKEYKEKEDLYIEKTSLNEYKIGGQYLKAIFQWIDYSKENIENGIDSAMNQREKYMAENISWILDYEKENGNSKLIIWSHNRHIAKKVEYYTSMGEHLHNKFGEDYYAMGLDFYEGKFRAFGVDIWGNPISNFLGKFNINSSPKKSLVYNIEKTDIPIAYLDFNTAKEDEILSEFLSTEQLVHNIGLMYPGKYTSAKLLHKTIKPYLNQVLIDSYDSFLFVNKITETKGVYDERDTKIEDGDKEIINHYWHILVGQGLAVASVLLVLILLILFIRKKIKSIKSGKGARYPGSSRWN